MPRWASRLTLEIAEVRCQRLQEISEDDAIAEGMGDKIISHGWNAEEKAVVLSSPIGRFCILWDEINAKRAPWSSNPWCWAITFQRVESR
jgi:hypothetical protein